MVKEDQISASVLENAGRNSSRGNALDIESHLIDRHVDLEKIASMPIRAVEEELLRMGVNPDVPVPESIMSFLYADDEESTFPTADEMKEALGARHVEKSAKLFSRLGKQAVRLDTGHTDAALLLCLYAQYLDIDSSYLARVQRAILEFQEMTQLTRQDQAYVETAQGFVALYCERYDDATAHFSYALILGEPMKDPELNALWLHNLARSYWKRGLYHVAFEFACKAREIYCDLNRPRELAAVELMESWLLFLLGKFEIAQTILSRVASEINRTGDRIDRGNVRSFYGRLAKQNGQYSEALKYFKESINEYERYSEVYRNVARSHSNIASVYRLMANELARTVVGARKEQDAERVTAELRERAYRHLEAAERLYGTDPYRHNRGLGKVYVYYALLDCDAGYKRDARLKAEKANTFGKVGDDNIVLSKAERIQSEVCDDADSALRLAESALRHAMSTDSRTEQAKAYLCLSINLLRTNRISDAQEFLEKIDTLLSPEEQARSDFYIPLLDLHRALVRLNGAPERVC